MIPTKADKRPRRYGWAPGDYVNKCRAHGCSTKPPEDRWFIGAKLAFHCADCAYAMPDPQPRVPCFMFGDLYGEFR